MKRVIRLTESDFTNLVKRVIKESKKQYLFEGKNKDSVAQLIKDQDDTFCKEDPSYKYCGSPAKIIYNYIKTEGMEGLTTDEDAIQGAIYNVTNSKIYNELKTMVYNKHKKSIMCWIAEEMPIYKEEGYGDSGFQLVKGLAHEKGNESYIFAMVDHLKQFDSTVKPCFLYTYRDGSTKYREM